MKFKKNNSCIKALIMFMMLLLYALPALAWLVDREDKVLNENSNQNELDEEGGEASKLTERELNRLYKEVRAKKAQELESFGLQPDFSDNKKWVSYSEDNTVQRTVNFEKNEIQLLMPRMERDGRVDFTALNDKALMEVADLLSTTVQEAMEDDPMFGFWQSVAGLEARDGIGYADKLSRLLVFSEMFPGGNPSRRSVEREASYLMEKSFVAYGSASSGGLERRVDVPIAMDRVDFRVPLPEDRLLKKAQEFQAIVTESAVEHNVPPHIIFAVIHTESHFNPLARSKIPAYGLMQVVPRTAGRDVSKFLYKDEKLKISSQFLFDPKNNVKVGTAYLRVLYYRYLKNIDDPQSRLYCTIAAYNTGTANVARAFVNQARMQEAVPYINKMESEEVLQRLLEKLPAQETKDYLRKILKRAPNYSHFDLSEKR